jgi:hypothetical protein
VRQAARRHGLHRAEPGESRGVDEGARYGHPTGGTATGGTATGGTTTGDGPPRTAGTRPPGRPGRTGAAPAEQLTLL